MLWREKEKDKIRLGTVKNSMRTDGSCKDIVGNYDKCNWSQITVGKPKKKVLMQYMKNT